MAFKKTFVACTSFLAMTLILTGCTEEAEDQGTTESTKSETAAVSNEIDSSSTQKVQIVTDTIYYFETAQEIVPYADVMVKGEVVETDSVVVPSDDGETSSVITTVKVKVEEDYLGQIPSGSEVYFIELGGTVLTSELPEKEKKSFEESGLEVTEYTEVIYNGTPTSKVGDTVLYFGVPDENNFYNLSLNETYYNLIGDDLSAFVLDEETNQFIRPVDEVSGTENPIVIENTDEALNEVASAD